MHPPHSHTEGHVLTDLMHSSDVKVKESTRRKAHWFTASSAGGPRAVQTV